MAEFLSDEWLSQQQQFAENLSVPENVEGTVQFIVSGTPNGDAKYFWSIKGGRFVAIESGETPNPRATATTAYKDAVAVSKGEIEISVAFMQGKLKFAGDMGFLLQLLPALQSPDYQTWQDKSAAETTYA